MPRRKKAIVSVTNDLYTDNRVNKVCTFLYDHGFEVTLVGRMRKDSVPLPPRSYRTKRFRLLWEKGPMFYAAYNLRLFIYLLTHRADLYVANDLDTLLANYAASKFKPGVRLVYDSHEYFTEVPELTGRPTVQKIWEGIEQWIFPKLRTVYTVNSSIALLYEKKYGKSLFVVRNISPKWVPTQRFTKDELGIPNDKLVIILQGAGINIDRGAEEAVAAMRLIDNAVLLIVGSGDVIEQLNQYVTDYDLQNKVMFFSKRPYAEMMAITAISDIGLTLDKPTNLNYKYSLPNKVFDYMHAGTPIIATDLPEVSAIITKYSIGTILQELSPEHLAAIIQNYINDPELLKAQKKNCIQAAQIENWENESEVLETIYLKNEE